MCKKRPTWRRVPGPLTVILERGGCFPPMAWTHRSLNDGPVGGMRQRRLPVMSIQYHPEAAPGPHDSLYLFREFRNVLDGVYR
jgi:carbamoylphosphate synthase small subunit